MLVRPVIDTLFFLKDISPLLSPLYVVGVAVPVLIAANIVTGSLPPVRMRPADWVAMILLLLTLWNVSGLLSGGISVESLETAVKVVTPFLIYFFLRHVIRSKRDLKGILITFLYSSSIPFAMILFEVLVHPLGAVKYTRGFVRLEGYYADSVSYGTYFVGAFIVAAYLLLDSRRATGRARFAFSFLAVGACTTVGLIFIHHVTSWLTFFAILALLIIMSLSFLPARRRSVAPAVVATFVLLGSLVAGETITKRIDAALKTETEVVEGDAQVTSAFHGRMSRWMRYADAWKDDTPLAAKALGVSLGSIEPGSYIMLLPGMHSDYVRMTFAVGVIGLGIYLFWYILFVLRALSFQIPERFLIWSSVVYMLAYSVSVTPSLYMRVTFLCFSILAFSLTEARSRSGAFPNGVRTRVAQVSEVS